ncbi:probable carboxylesterase 2 [Telopea speciosissima]|uniref:probable carboxylesterase 2 n=1 Tax=Telopea speciosissima TaxID=54955 RepID=UPI001CC6CA00|nr:probable carboxylesterase 2 [Telopea speciosissima]
MNSEMDSSSPKPEIFFNFRPFFRIYKDGSIDRLTGNDIVPPSIDPQTGVSSKDVLIVPETGVAARIFLPKITNSTRKLPLLIYVHGGGFCIETPFSPAYHNYVSSLVAKANVVAVSIHYRRAPEHPLPIAYDDSWAAIQWVASHSKRNGTESWLNKYADFDRFFMAGDSAGANIAHNLAMKSVETPLKNGVKIVGLGMVHPYFHGEEPLGPEASEEEKRENVDLMWLSACPSTSGCDDPRVNPAACKNLASLACKRVLVFLAGSDVVRDGGVFYYETLKKSGWKGKLELMDVEGENHVFHISKPNSEKALAMLDLLASFLNQMDQNYYYQHREEQQIRHDQYVSLRSSL